MTADIADAGGLPGDAEIDLHSPIFRRLEQLNAIGAALSSERDINTLLEKILLAAKEITHADGGTLYRVTDDEKGLRFEILRNDTLKIALGGTSGNPITFPNLPFANEQGEQNNSMVAVYAALHQQTVNIADAYTAEGFDFSGTRKFDTRTGYRSKSFLTVPMKNHENTIIGVLQLINSIHPASGEVVPFSLADQSLAESLSSQAAIALTNRLLISQLEELFESFIGLINLAIDEKSPYTGGHCERVPILTMMLAEAANDSARGELAGFHMSDQDRYELKIAGLLHDCGKVTTPVHVVDKATKLQTLYDRIHTIDTRFEVLKRDAEIEMLRRQLELRQPRDLPAEAALNAACEASISRYDHDREFLRHANVGGERMLDADLQRLRDIGGGYRWRDVAGADSNFLSADELENLTIRAGTLTQAEREVINHHIVATIKMLEQLPWPKHLRHVPEYAGGHHERMDGKGYPKGLTREQMSVQARIMGIADIFEALTARDRPYKLGKTLSESLTILGKFKEGGHIDPDLFDVFIRQRVYLRYAEKFLDPQQIDSVDDSRIPGYDPVAKSSQG
jgi:HD-GYP domain-containing protein (c-di-GMP phosphodiesterase class II)